MSRQFAATTNWVAHATAAEWCVERLAGLLGYSLSKLERHFRTEYQQCPQAWLRESRMTQAAKCLAEGKNVQETAQIVAYQSQYAFSLAFKRYYGYPPKEHRTRLLTGQLTGIRANGQTGKRANGQTGKRANGQNTSASNRQTLKSKFRNLLTRLEKL